MKNIKKFFTVLSFTLATSFFANVTQAGIIDIDLTGFVSGSAIFDAAGADIGHSFGPGLTLNSGGNRLGQVFNPGCTGCDSGMSILPQPNNQGPLAILLDSQADSFELVMGHAQGGAGSSVDIDFLSSAGNVIQTIALNFSNDYNKYSFSGFGNFQGIYFYNNIDPAGVRYMDMAYNMVAGSVPEPATLGLLGIGLLGLGLSRRRSQKA